MIHEDHAFLCDAVDVRRRSAHHPTVVGTDVPHPDVVAPDDQDVRLLAGLSSGGRNEPIVIFQCDLVFIS